MLKSLIKNSYIAKIKQLDKTLLSESAHMYIPKHWHTHHACAHIHTSWKMKAINSTLLLHVQEELDRLMQKGTEGWGGGGWGLHGHAFIMDEVILLVGIAYYIDDFDSVNGVSHCGVNGRPDLIVQSLNLV